MVEHVYLVCVTSVCMRLSPECERYLSQSTTQNENQSFGCEDPNRKAFKAATDDGKSFFAKVNTTADARAKLDREAQGLHSMVSK